MEEDFNLGEKLSMIRSFNLGETEVVTIKDLKEFIKRDGELIEELFKNIITIEELWKKRDKILGNKLR